jgi:hypothetical protein
MTVENRARKDEAKTGWKECEESFIRHNKEKRPAFCPTSASFSTVVLVRGLQTSGAVGPGPAAH